MGIVELELEYRELPNDAILATAGTCQNQGNEPIHINKRRV
jgi:hypothetical protein